MTNHDTSKTLHLSAKQEMEIEPDCFFVFLPDGSMTAHISGSRIITMKSAVAGLLHAASFILQHGLPACPGLVEVRSGGLQHVPAKKRAK
jgi:hypothetical protein